VIENEGRRRNFLVYGVIFVAHGCATAGMGRANSLEIEGWIWHGSGMVVPPQARAVPTFWY